MCGQKNKSGAVNLVSEKINTLDASATDMVSTICVKFLRSHTNLIISYYANMAMPSVYFDVENYQKPQN